MPKLQGTRARFLAYGLSAAATAAGFASYTGRSVDGSPFSITYLIEQAANGQPLTGSAHR